MKEFTVNVKDASGIHARPAGLLVKEASKFQSDITIIKEEKEADGKKLFGVMGLGIKRDDKIIIRISGADEKDAETALKKFFEENL